MDNFKNRRGILVSAIVIAFAVIAFRLFQVQILDKEYRVTAENNALKYETLYPARGRILDRNGDVLVDNKLTYDIMVTPSDVKRAPYPKSPLLSELYQKHVEDYEQSYAKWGKKE